MSHDELPPLNDEVRALLERAVPPPLPAGFEERVSSRLSQTLAAPPSGPSSSGPPGGGLTGTFGSGTLMAVGVVTATLGLAGGVLLERFVLAPTVVVERAAPPPPPPEPVTLAPAEPPKQVPEPVEPPKPVTPTPRPSRLEPPRPLPPTRDVALATERALLEVARTALATGDSSGALAALERHGREFPKGRMVEEREALLVQVLVRVGRLDEARRHAQDFRTTFPDSLMRPVVDALVPPD